MKKIYIAGKISGECETPELMEKCIDKFNNYGKSLSFGRFSAPRNYFASNQDETLKFTHGIFINADLIAYRGGTWEHYMKNDIPVMLTCDEVHFLPDWVDSKGAKLEHYIAEYLNMKIIYVSR
jgi:Domain of unknown function (DUF4406)